MIGKKSADPNAFFACIGARRTCGKNALPGKLTCAEHIGENTIELPHRVLIRAHFSPKSRYGWAIVEELCQGGVRLIERTTAHQQELELKRMMAIGIKVFGDNDLRPNVAVNRPVEELEKTGYRLNDLHILSYDEIFAATAPEKVGSRVVVLSYELQPEPGVVSIPIPETAQEIIQRPFISCRVWVNLIDSRGTQLHAVELTAFQFTHKPRFFLRFTNSVWGFERNLEIASNAIA